MFLADFIMAIALCNQAISEQLAVNLFTATYSRFLVFFIIEKRFLGFR